MPSRLKRSWQHMKKTALQIEQLVMSFDCIFYSMVLLTRCSCSLICVLLACFCKRCFWRRCRVEQSDANSISYRIIISIRSKTIQAAWCTEASVPSFFLRILFVSPYPKPEFLSLLEGLFKDSYPCFKAFFTDSHPCLKAFLGVLIFVWRLFLGVLILFEDLFRDSYPFLKTFSSTVLGKDLAARNANLDAKDKGGRTPMALKAKRAEVVKDLASFNGSLLDGCLKLCWRQEAFLICSMAWNLIAFELRTCRFIHGMRHHIHGPTSRTIS